MAVSKQKWKWKTGVLSARSFPKIVQKTCPDVENCDRVVSRNINVPPVSRLMNEPTFWKHKAIVQKLEPFHNFFMLKDHHSNGFSPKSSKNLQKKRRKFPFFLTDFGKIIRLHRFSKFCRNFQKTFYRLQIHEKQGNLMLISLKNHLKWTLFLDHSLVKSKFSFFCVFLFFPKKVLNREEVSGKSCYEIHLPFPPCSFVSLMSFARVQCRTKIEKNNDEFLKNTPNIEYFQQLWSIFTKIQCYSNNCFSWKLKKNVSRTENQYKR